MLSKEQVKEICNIQHKITVCAIIISKMPIAYTNDTIYRMEKDLKIREMHSNLEEEMSKLITKYGAEAIGATFTDKELMHSPEYRFTFDDQRKATYEVIGQELTLEEVLDKYS